MSLQFESIEIMKINQTNILAKRKTRQKAGFNNCRYTFIVFLYWYFEKWSGIVRTYEGIPMKRHRFHSTIASQKAQTKKDIRAFALCKGARRPHMSCRAIWLENGSLGRPKTWINEHTVMEIHSHEGIQ